MNTRAVILATIACATLGCWLPSLWLPGPVEKTRSILPPPVAAAREPGWQSLAAKVRGAGSAMQQFQAVVAGVRGHGAALAFHKGESEDLLCEEAEELAARLAGEELGAHVADGAAFLKSLRDCDYHTRQAALEAWAEADPEAALGALMADAGPNSTVESALIQRLAARDTDKALALLRALPPTAAGASAQLEVWSAVLAACAVRGPEYALPAIQSAPPRVQEEGIYSLLREMAAKDPRAALAWSALLPPELKKPTDDTVIMRKWGEADPAAALAYWRERPQTDDYEANVSQRLAAQWAAKDPEAFLQWAAAQGKEAGRFLGIAAMEMATRDPRRAVAMVAGLKSEDLAGSGSSPDLFPGDALHEIQTDVWQKWAQRDPAAVLAWARTLPSEKQRADVINSVSYHLKGLPKEELRAAAQEIGTGTRAGFQILWEADPEEAARVFKSQPIDQRLEIFDTVRRSLARETPAALAKLLTGVIEDFPVQDSGSHPTLANSVAGVAAAWAGRDAAAAAAWVDQLPPGESQATAAANVVLTWGRYDFPAAQAWVKSLPAGAARDRANAQLANLTAASGAE